ncbi:MAG TPA: hypothetical protein VN646_04115 [Candidatus Acidoferrum sp.]|nr:hypothetical protein [Candidatus Acidoferrum sp.]
MAGSIATTLAVSSAVSTTIAAGISPFGATLRARASPAWGGAPDFRTKIATE